MIEEYYTQPPKPRLHTNYRGNGESLTLPLFIITKLQFLFDGCPSYTSKLLVTYLMKTSCNSPAKISTSSISALIPSSPGMHTPRPLTMSELQLALNNFKKVPKRISLPILLLRMKSSMTSSIMLFMLPPRPNGGEHH